MEIKKPTTRRFAHHHPRSGRLHRSPSKTAIAVDRPARCRSPHIPRPPHRRLQQALPPSWRARDRFDRPAQPRTAGHQAQFSTCAARPQTSPSGHGSSSLDRCCRRAAGSQADSCQPRLVDAIPRLDTSRPSPQPRQRHPPASTHAPPRTSSPQRLHHQRRRQCGVRQPAPRVIRPRTDSRSSPSAQPPAAQSYVVDQVTVSTTMTLTLSIDRRAPVDRPQPAHPLCHSLRGLNKGPPVVHGLRTGAPPQRQHSTTPAQGVQRAPPPPEDLSPLSSLVEDNDDFMLE